MNCRYTYQKVCQVLLLLLWVSWAGCQREEIIPEAGTSEPGETRMNPAVLVLDTTDLTNPFRTNGQVRFDIIGDLPEIQKGKHFFYPLSGGIYGSVTQYIVNGSRLTIDLSRTALETVWKRSSCRTRSERASIPAGSGFFPDHGSTTPYFSRIPGYSTMWLKGIRFRYW